MNNLKLIKTFFLLLLILIFAYAVVPTPELEEPDGSQGAKKDSFKLTTFSGAKLGEENNDYYEIIAGSKGGIVQIGDPNSATVLQMPSNSKLFIRKSENLLAGLIVGELSLDQRITLLITSESNGELGFSNLMEDFRPKIVFDNGDEVSFLGEENVDLMVKKGTLELGKDKRIKYRNGYSDDNLILESDSVIKINQKGLTGGFKVIQEETDFVIGEIEGENVVTLSGSKFPEGMGFGENIIVFSKDFVNKFIKGNVKYKDNAYEFMMETKKAKVEIKFAIINFLEGDSKVTRGRLLLEVKGKTILTPSPMELVTNFDSIDRYKTDIILTTENEGVVITDWGRLRHIEISSEGDFELVTSLRDKFGINLNPAQIEDYKAYRDAGASDYYASRMIAQKIKPEVGVPFVEAGFDVEGATDLTANKVKLEIAKEYKELGIDPLEIASFVGEGKTPEDIRKEYGGAGIEKNLDQVIRVEAHSEFIVNYRKELERYKMTKEGKGFFPPSVLNDGELYARLSVYNIRPERLNYYSEELSKYPSIKLSSEDIGGFVEVVRLKLPIEMIKDSFDKGTKTFSDIADEYNKERYGVSFVEFDKYQKAAKKELSFEEVAQFKVLNIVPEALIKNPDLQNSQEFQKQVEEEKAKLMSRISKLRLKEDRYSLATLKTLSETWNAKKLDKPVALMILNRNDDEWGAFADDDENYASLSKNYSLLIAEASEDKEAIKMIKMVGNKFGKVGLMWKGGHGEPFRINLGKGEDEKYYIDNTDEDLYRTMRDWTKEDAIIVLQSCSTGRGKGSIGEYISSATQRTVFAPSCPISGQRLVFEDNKLKNVEYEGWYLDVWSGVKRKSELRITRKFKPETSVPEVKPLKTGK